MSRWVSLLAGLTLIGLVGCETGQVESAEANTRIVRSLNDAAIRNALIRQRTLYPYHFEPESAELNELGRRELDVLTEYFRRRPGALNIRQADTPTLLYEGRVSTVRDLLATAGVDVGGMTFQDGPAGGDGRPAHEVIAISENRNSPSRPLYYGQGSGTVRSGGGQGSSGNSSNSQGTK